MTFTRSVSGLSNYKYFFSSDITLYVEGRLNVEHPAEDPSRPDTKFYQALCSKYLNGRSVKVKLVGNRKNALDYHKKIVGSKIDNSLVIIDRDFDGITLSDLEKPKLILTCGYSWENDFWTEELLLYTLSSVTANDHNAVDYAKPRIRRTLNRLAKLSVANAAMHIDGKTLFKSNGKSKGIAISPSLSFPLSSKECKRLAKLIPSMCPAMSGVQQLASRNISHRLIQGHLLEFVALKILAYAFSSSSGTSIGNTTILMNVALSSFERDPGYFVTDEVDKYYKREFRRAI
ncbi:DUF4435 domain-containing protein [Vreelandella aquamarina]|uniref:DUF4435 domain-containing protein n=1 Tax=Vreelandella aquamarina TaxID=77097 RepID=UPI00384CBE74